MSKELKQLEKWIDENKGTALHPIMGNNPSITQLFIDTLLQKITELKAEEGIESEAYKSLPLCTRVEVIDKDGRTYINYKSKNVHTSMQDGNRTLKIFID